ncbi:alpha carbonic anhydrase 1, chloroplastic [Malania oleifera]|uniref:alpha carbonic anhydrase 1, chloroplastic n=1 Tax=Malania oleifera TaxID=397392 RepID=UPI0025ADCFC2|nr:alpha carbonic anhydrase 1, chloroplastic [Malania oleifera]
MRKQMKPDKEAEFSYTGATGPQNWGSLASAFATCSSGKSQSPIDIVKDAAVHNPTLKALNRLYSPANATLVNSGARIGIHYERYAGALVIDGKNYTLKQMHWHCPSEHRIDGVQYPAELHLVHMAADGSASVVAILFRYGKEDPFLTKIKEGLEALTKEKCEGGEEAHIPLGELDAKILRKNTRKYFRYVGSLTTPPCSENVTWNILGKIRTISKEQVEALKSPLASPFQSNCRPVQPLNGRSVHLYDELSH